MARATDNKQKLVQVPLNGGMNQSIDERDAPPGTLVSLENVRINKSLTKKRAGYSAISLSNTASRSLPMLGNGSTTYIEKPAMLSSVGDIPLLATTSGKVYAPNDESGTSWFSEVGHISTCKPLGSKANASFDAQASVYPATAIDSSGNRLVAYSTTGYATLVVSVSDPNGKPIGLLALVTGIGNICGRVVAFAIGSTFYVVYGMHDGATQTIQVRQLAVQSGQLAATATPATIASNSSASTVMFLDAVSTRTISGSPCWALAYCFGGDSNVTIATLTGTTTRHTSTVAISTPDASRSSVCIWWDSAFNYLWVGFQNDATHTAVIVVSDDDPATVINAKSTLSGAGSSAALLIGGYRGAAINTLSTALLCQTNTSLMSALFRVRDTSTGANSSEIDFVRVISKPDDYGRFWAIFSDSLPYSGATPDEAASYWFALVRHRMEKTSLVSASPVVELYWGPFVGSSVISDICGADAGQFIAAAVGTDATSVALPSGLGTVLDIRELFYETAEQDPHFSAAAGSPTTVSAGQPTEHLGLPQGNQLLGTAGATTASNVQIMGSAEIGFANVPQISPGAYTAGSASRSLRAVLSWADRYGRKHTSQPSLPVTITADNISSVSLTVYAASVGQRVNPNSILFQPMLEVYSTVDGGTEYFLSATFSLTYAAAAVVTLSKTDLQLESQPILYTDGGVLPNTLAPSNRFQVFSDDRLWVAGGFEPNIVTCSKVIIPTEPIQFTSSDAFKVAVPDEVTGLAFMDGSLVIFCERSIYQLSGQGPNDQGVGEFSEASLVSSGVGCINYKSILKTEQGILFQSRRGIYLLPRGLGIPDFVGTEVQDELAAYPTCLGSVVAQDANFYLARFLMAAEGSTSSAVILVYDLTRDIWFKDIVGTEALSEIARWPDAFVAWRESLNSAGTTGVLEEDDTVSADAGTTIVQRYETAWVYPFGPGGYGHIRKCQIALELLGTSSTFTLSVQTDSNTAQTQSWTATGSIGDIVYREMAITVDQCGCCKVILSDTAGAGFRQVSCTLEVDDDGGIRLLDPAMRA